MINDRIKWCVDIDLKLDKAFRLEIGKRKGAYRGAINDALVEAINDWIKK